MARARKFKTGAALEKAWEEYKNYCDNKTVVTTSFSQKESRFITAVVPHPITYTIKGFCGWVGITEAGFYDLYNKDEKLESVITRMKQDCENDAREKFENGTLDSKLAGLWMSNYGYTTSTKVEADVSPIVIKDDVMK